MEKSEFSINYFSWKWILKALRPRGNTNSWKLWFDCRTAMGRKGWKSTGYVWREARGKSVAIENSDYNVWWLWGEREKRSGFLFWFVALGIYNRRKKIYYYMMRYNENDTDKTGESCLKCESNSTSLNILVICFFMTIIMLNSFPTCRVISIYWASWE